MNITRINIHKLFHLYNYDIPFTSDSKVSIITGPNGYGKTTILTMLSELSNTHLYYFYLLPFEKVLVSFTDNSEIQITQQKIKREEQVEGDSRLTLDTEVRFSWIVDGEETAFFLLNEKLIRDAYRRGVLRMMTDSRGHFDIRSKNFAKTVMNSNRFYEIIARSLGQEQFLLRLNSLNFEFIPANRIYKTEDDKEEDETPLKKASAEMKEILRRIQYDYYYASQQSDSELMITLLKSQEEFSEPEYVERSKHIEEYTSRLADFGFLGRTRMQPYEVKNARILSTYIVEYEKKLQVFQTIMKKLKENWHVNLKAFKI